MIFLLLFGFALGPDFCEKHLIADEPKLTQEQKDMIAREAEKIRDREKDEP